MKKISKKLKSIRFFDITNLAIVTIIALVSVMPVIFIINNAFKPLSELFKYPPTFFVRNPTWQNFENSFMRPERRQSPSPDTFSTAYLSQW